MQLREYQSEAIEAVHSAWKKHRAVVVALPTGTGKTIVATHLLPLRPHGDVGHFGRWLFIAHRDELVQQIADSLRSRATQETIDRAGTNRPASAGSVGVFTGSEQAQDDFDHAVCTVQWLVNNLDFLGEHNFYRLVIDEAHHATAPTYRAVIQKMQKARTALRILGLTATVKRADGVPLAEVFDTVAYNKPVKWFVGNGYLVPAEAYRVECDIDLSRTETSRNTGDYIINDSFLAAVEASNWLQVVSQAWLDQAAGKKTIAFCASVRQSKQLAGRLQEQGITAVHLDGETPHNERRQLLDDFSTGKITVLCNVAVLTEGYDEPSIECVLMARPTKSQLFYIQCIGRALRLYKGKEKAIILDFGASDHSLVQLADLDGDFNLRRLRDEVEPVGWYGSDFIDEVFLSLRQRRAILHFAAGNAYARAVELLKHPKLAWGVFGDCAILDVADDKSVLVLSPGRAHGIEGSLRTRVQQYAEMGLYTVLSVPKEGQIKVVGTGTPDDVVEVASDYAEAVSTRLADGTARWRRKPPSGAQIGFLSAKGISAAKVEGLNRGDVSSIISWVLACERVGVDWRA